MGETFWQFRPFMQGESAQRIDWRRSARSDQLYVREREWEAAHDYHLWMDASPSMAWRSSLSSEDKLDGRWCSALRSPMCWCAAASGSARWGSRRGLGAGHRRSPRPRHRRRSADAHGDAAPGAAAPARAAGADLGFSLRCRGALRRIAGICRRGGVRSAADDHRSQRREFPLRGETLFRDTDGGGDFHAGAAQSLRAAYAERYAAHRAGVAEAARRAGFLFLPAPHRPPGGRGGAGVAMGLQGTVERRA